MVWREKPGSAANWSLALAKSTRMWEVDKPTSEASWSLSSQNPEPQTSLSVKCLSVAGPGESGYTFSVWVPRTPLEAWNLTSAHVRS